MYFYYVEKILICVYFVILFRNTKTCKRVTFADGIYPGEELAASPTHGDNDRPLSPPPLKALMRETLKYKRNLYPLKKLKMRTKVTMVNKKKVATVNPSIKFPSSSDTIEYYISRRSVDPNLNITETFVRSDDSSNNSDIGHHSNDRISSTRLAREVTPVPLDNECWNDE